MNCSTGKRCFEQESLALEALIQNHAFNNYSSNEGPINVYECPQCGCWHFTSKGNKHSIFEDSGVSERIKRERVANYWERKLR